MALTVQSFDFCVRLRNSWVDLNEVIRANDVILIAMKIPLIETDFKSEVCNLNRMIARYTYEMYEYTSMSIEFV